MEMTLFQILWFILIAVLIAGYFVLDGFDLGAGVLYPFIAKNDTEKAVVRRSIGPVWDGNEVWLLTAGGALFAAFPPAYATTFSGFYLAIMLVLFGLIVRAVSLEFRGYDPAWARAWDICFFVGSLLPALLFGVAIGNVYAGIPMDMNGDYIGLPLIGLITPFTLLCGLLGLAMFVAQGVTWLALKAPHPSAIQARVVKMRMPVQVVTLILFVVVTIYALFIIQPHMVAELAIVRYALAALFVIGIIASLVVGRKKGKDVAPFLLQSATVIVLVALLGSSLFPNLVVASVDSIGPSITLVNSSSELSLMWMSIIAAIGVPLVLIYHVIVYRIFRGRVKEDELQY